MDKQDNQEEYQDKMDNTRRFESMLFNYETTVKTDYRYGQICQPPEIDYFKEKKTCRMQWRDPLRNLHTMTDWKEGKVRFDLFLKPKDVVRTDPGKIQDRYAKPEDTCRAEVQRTRPRLVMTPAVSMDDITDPQARQLLVDDMYISTAVAGMRAGVRPYFRVEAPFTGKPAISNPVVLPKWNPPMVPEEWRMDSVKWDNHQRRSYVDPTQEFWLNYPLFKCRACDESAIVKNKRMLSSPNNSSIQKRL